MMDRLGVDKYLIKYIVFHDGSVSEYDADQHDGRVSPYYLCHATSAEEAKRMAQIDNFL